MIAVCVLFRLTRVGVRVRVMVRVSVSFGLDVLALYDLWNLCVRVECCKWLRTCFHAAAATLLTLLDAEVVLWCRLINRGHVVCRRWRHALTSAARRSCCGPSVNCQTSMQSRWSSYDARLPSTLPISVRTSTSSRCQFLSDRLRTV